MSTVDEKINYVASQLTKKFNNKISSDNITLVVRMGFLEMEKFTSLPGPNKKEILEKVMSLIVDKLPQEEQDICKIFLNKHLSDSIENMFFAMVCNVKSGCCPFFKKKDPI